MRANSFSRPPIIDRDVFHGPLFIAVGVGVLLAASWLPTLPVISSMALLAVGATSVTLARFRGTPALLPIMLVHSTTYGGLYILYVCAAFHRATIGDTPGLSLLHVADIMVSILLMVGVLARTLRDFRPQLRRKQ